MKPEAEIACEGDDSCPSKHSCVSGRCIPENGNQPPTVSIGIVPASASVVTVPVTVFDAESDDVTLSAEVGQAGLFAPITITSPPLQASPDGVTTTFTWDAVAHFGSSSLYAGLKLRVTPRDRFRPGAAVLSEAFDFGSDAPVITAINVPDARGRVTVDFTVQSSRPVRLKHASLQLPSSSIEIPIDASNFPTSTLDKLSGAVSITWDTGVSAPFRSGDALLALVVEDEVNAVSLPALSAPFIIDNAPAATVTYTAPAGGSRYLNSVPVSVAASDPNGQAVTLSWEFREGQGAWQTAHGDAPDATHFLWDAKGDLGGAVTRVTSNGNAEILPFHGQLALRATPTDAGGLSGDPGQTAPFNVGDDPQTLLLYDFVGAQRGAVPIAFVLDDNALDLTNVEIEFCAQDCSGNGWREAAIQHGSLTSLNSGGLDYIVTWDSAADPAPSGPQGIGHEVASDVQIRARPSARVDGVTTVYADWSAKTISQVSNAGAPKIDNVEISRLSVQGGNAPVVIDYTLYDDESDTADFLCEFSTNQGINWQRCSEYPIALSDGSVDLATAPPQIGVGGGVRHRYVWDPSGLMQAVTATRLRLSASDGGSSSSRVISVSRNVSPLDVPPAPNNLLYGQEGEAYPSAGLGIFQEGMAVADFNGDGFMDVAGAFATAIGNGGFMRVFTTQQNNGLITNDFNPPLDFNFGNTWWPTDMRAGDFDGNGYTDLIVTSDVGTGVRMFMGGLGGLTASFQNPMQVYGTYCGVKKAAVADFNRDGRDDAAFISVRWSGLTDCAGKVSTFAGSSFPNEGLDYFQRFLYPITEDFTDLATGDFDGDGWADIMLIKNRTWALMRNNGAGGMIYSPSLPTGALGGTGVDVEAIDVDGDGVWELVVAEGAAGAEIYKSVERGRWSPKRSTLTSNEVNYIGFGDANADGRKDLLLSGAGGGHLGITLNLNDGHDFGPAIFIAPPRLFPPHSPRHATSMQAAHPINPSPGNGPAVVDRMPDLVYYSQNTDAAWDTQRRLRGAERGHFWADNGYDPPAPLPGIWKEPEPIDTLCGKTFASIAADVDGDGDRDLFTACEDGVLINRGSHSTGPGAVPFTPEEVKDIGVSARALVSADFDLDGFADVVVAGFGGARVMRGTALGGPLAGDSLAGIGDTFALATADFDGNGYPDVVAADVDDSVVVWLFGSGGVLATTGFTTTSAQSPTPAGTAPDYPMRALAAADVNGDGHRDVLVTSAGPAAVHVYLGDGTGKFGAAITTNVTIPVPGTLSVADFDRDGIPDVLLGGAQSNDALVLWGQGDGTFPSSDPLSGVGEGLTSAVADFDGDGVLDFVIGGTYQGTRVVRGSGVRGAPSAGAWLTASPSVVAMGQVGEQHHVCISDFDNDGVPDLVVTPDEQRQVRLLTTRRQGRLSHHRQLVATVAPTGLDRFGYARLRQEMTFEVAQFGPAGTADPEGEARTALAAALAGYVPVTPMFFTAGDARARRQVSGVATLESRLPPGASIKLELPIEEPVLTSTLSYPMKVVRGVVDYAHDGSNQLPRLVGAENMFDHVWPSVTWEEVPFTLSNRTVKLTTDRLGYFQVFVDPP